MKRGKPSGLAIAGLLLIAGAVVFQLWGVSLIETIRREFNWEAAWATLNETREVRPAEVTARATAEATVEPTAAPTVEPTPQPTAEPNGALISRVADMLTRRATPEATPEPTTAPTASMASRAAAALSNRATAEPTAELRNGYHEIALPGGAMYMGNYVDGKRSGYGEYYYADGSCYKGEFLNNRFDGVGVLYDADGEVILEGIWEEGRHVF